LEPSKLAEKPRQGNESTPAKAPKKVQFAPLGSGASSDAPLRNTSLIARLQEAQQQSNNQPFNVGPVTRSASKAGLGTSILGRKKPPTKPGSGCQSNLAYVEETWTSPKCSTDNVESNTSCESCSAARSNYVGHADEDDSSPATAPRSDASSFQQAEYIDDLEYGVTYVRPPPTERQEEYEMTGGAGPAGTLDARGNQLPVSGAE